MKLEIGMQVVAEIVNLYTHEVRETISGIYQGYDGAGSVIILQADGRLRYVDHWLIKTADEHAKIIVARITRAATPAPELIRCSCGHSIPRDQIMNASLGTSCPDCYDRMSS